MRKVREFSVDLGREDFDRTGKDCESLKVPDKTPATMGDLRDAMITLIYALLEDLNDIADELPDK